MDNNEQEYASKTHVHDSRYIKKDEAELTYVTREEFNKERLNNIIVDTLYGLILGFLLYTIFIK